MNVSTSSMIQGRSIEIELNIRSGACIICQQEVIWYIRVHMYILYTHTFICIQLGKFAFSSSQAEV